MMGTDGKRVVVVGIDGSDASRAALAHAAWEAHRRRATLRLVHSHSVVVPYSVMGLAPDPVELSRAAKVGAEMLADFESQAQQAYPELRVDGEVIADSPGGALVAASADADLVVVGSRGLGGFSGLLLGSAGAQLAAHSHAPVIVIRPPDEKGNLGVGPPHRPVVVGIDGIPDSEAALAFAFDEASARGVPLMALYAWWMLPPSGVGPMAPQHYDFVSAEDEARRMLAEATAGWCGTYPDVEVNLIPARFANPTVALLELSKDAGLLVVSRHGGNALSRLLFASTGDIAVREAECPVAVVPEQST
jgi:nucleotide-binding universal stress UspA family protein